EVWLPSDLPAALSAALRGELRVRDPAGQVVHREELRADPVQHVAWQPASEGKHAIELELAFGGQRLLGRGSLVVGAPAPVLLLGPGAELLARVLAVQGVAASVVNELPVPLARGV